MLIDMKEEKWGGGGGGRNVSGMWGVKKLVGDLGRLSGHVDIVSGLCAPPPHLPAPTCQRTHARIQDHGQAEWSRISLLASLSLSFLICSAVFALPASLGRGAGVTFQGNSVWRIPRYCRHRVGGPNVSQSPLPSPPALPTDQLKTRWWEKICPVRQRVPRHREYPGKRSEKQQSYRRD